jgi:hypothetical protein
MAYEIEFATDVSVTDPEIYINDCCWGGDVVRDRLLPIVSTTRVYDSVRTGQEDWGWFLWMRLGKELTRVHIQCDDKDGGIFRIHVFGSVKQWLRWKDIDTLEVERMNEVILNEIKKWGTINRTKRFTPDFTREI